LSTRYTQRRPTTSHLSTGQTPVEATSPPMSALICSAGRKLTWQKMWMAAKISS
jgi:hypothetical protein